MRRPKRQCDLMPHAVVLNLTKSGLRKALDHQLTRTKPLICFDRVGTH